MSASADRGRVFRLFAEALTLEEPERSRFIANSCPDDAAIQAEIAALLAVAAGDSASTSALAGVSAPPPPAPDPDLLVGREFGRFRLARFVAAGGMGVVYRADRTDGLEQTVAIKLLANELGHLSRERFQRETQLLARLEHPNIARLIDAGVDDGRAWIALEFVHGRTIDEYCDDEHLDVRERVKLLIQLAGAVAAAHRMLVVHRDIKPGNVLVTSDGLPKLIDFGIAAVLQAEGATNTPTLDVGRLFTPQYSAPEQVAGEPVTVATDVFGLGALGYRLLSGRVAFPDAHRAVDYLVAVTQHDVDPASEAAEREGAPERARLLRGDLDAILTKAMAREPVQRYASATDLKDDLQRHLEDLPITARAPSVWIKAAKFVRRNRLAVALATLLGASLIGGTIAYGVQARKTLVAGEMALRRGQFLEHMLKSADPRGGRRDITVAEVLDAAADTLTRTPGAEPLVDASLFGLICDTNAGLGRYAEALTAGDRRLALLQARGGSPTDIGRALAARGDVLNSLSRFAEAKSAYRQALPLLREHAVYDYAAALDGLGKSLTSTDGVDEAVQVLQESAAIYDKGDPAHQALARNPLEDLVMALRLQGRYPQALEVARQALALYRQALPADHPDVLVAQTNYASALELTNHVEEAGREYAAVVDASVRVLGPEHMETLIRQEELARNLFNLHQNARGATLLRSTAASLEHVAGPGHVYSLQAWTELAINSCNGDDPAGGLAAIRHVSDIIDKNPNDNGFNLDWHVIGARALTGRCLVALHRYREAEPLLVTSAAGLEARRGVDFVGTQMAYDALRQLYLATHRPAEAARVAAKIR